MKKWFIIAIIMIMALNIAGCGTSKGSDGGVTGENADISGEAVTSTGAVTSPAVSSTEASPSVQAIPVDQDGTIRLEGTIDHLKIHMNILIEDGLVKGVYYYDKIKTNIVLKGTIEENRMITINEYDVEGNLNGTFDGWYVPGIRMNGSWSSPGADENLTFELTVIDGIPDDAVWAGEWTRLGSSRFGSSTLVIFNETSNGFDFQMDAYDGHHLGPVNIGFISGTARIQGSTAAYYEDSETGAQLVFILKDGLLELTANDMANGQAGAGVEFGGKYTIEEIKDTLLSMGYVYTEEVQKVFEDLVGDDVALFLDTAQVVDYLDDLDGFRAITYHWYVFGLEGTCESVSMFLPDGTICAAVIDPEHDRIKVYTNAEYIVEVPKTIQSWIDGLPISDVLFIKSSS